MKCEACREMIDLAFGLDDLSGEVKAHLDTCHKCRVYFQESQALASALPEGKQHDPTEDELNRIVGGVKQAMSENSNSLVTASPKRSYVYMAAAVILLALGVYWSSFRSSSDDATEQALTIADSIVESQVFIPDGLVSELVMADQSYQPDQNAYEMLLSEYTFGRSLVAGDELLIELSEEELNFLELEENFDIEELVL